MKPQLRDSNFEFRKILQSSLALLLLLVAMSLLSCSPKSSDEKWVRPIHRTKPEIPPPEVEVKQEAVGVSSPIQKFDPKVDILFVIDNSTSMDKHQEALVNNIDKFVSKFSSHKIVDYHIGVIATWDTETFSQGAYQSAFPNKLKRGELKPIRYVSSGSVKDQKGVFLTSCPPFVQRVNPCFKTAPEAAPFSNLKSHQEDAVARVLKSTLFIGVDKFEEDLSKVTPGTDGYHRGGPQYEEVFTALEGAIEQFADKNSPAAGFLRAEAPLVIIIISDADESSSISPETMAEKLIGLKGGDASKVNVLSVLVNKEDKDESKDPGIRVNTSGRSSRLGEPVILSKFTELFVASGNGRRLSINNNNYGVMLAEMGDFVNEKVMRKVIPLESRPEWGTIVVHYGDQVIPAHYRNGWTYDSELNAIVMNPGIEFKYQEGAEIKIQYVPLNLEDVSRGKLKRVE